MAKIISKGTVINQTISCTLTAVAQIISAEHSGAETETYDATTLDTTGAGKEYAPTGYAEGGSVSFELFYDPALSGHQSITDDLTTPVEREWSIVFSDSTAALFDAAGVGFGFSIDMADATKGSVDLKLDQLLTYPT